MQGLSLKHDPEKRIEFYFNAKFYGEQNQDKGADPGSVLSRIGYIFIYDICPIIWMIRIK